MLRFAFQRRTDPLTGVTVTQLTEGHADHISLYLTANAFTSDGEHLVFASDRTGEFQFYLLSLKTGEVQQLTNQQGVLFHSGCVSQRDRLYYSDGQAVYEVDLASGRDEEVFRAPEGMFIATPLSCSGDGNWVLGCYGALDFYARYFNSGWSHRFKYFQFYHRPLSVIFAIHVPTRQAHAVWGDHIFISHVQFNPQTHREVLFCQEGDFKAPQRMFVVTFDEGPRKRLARPLYAERDDEVVSHEFYVPTGVIGFQVKRYSDPHNPQQWHGFCRSDGSDLQFYFAGEDMVWNHLQTNADGRIGVTDSLMVGEMGREERWQYLALLRYDEPPRVTTLPLCWHGTSWQKRPGEAFARCHPHPVFAPDQRHILFTSDASGHCHLYLADAAPVLERLLEGEGK
jgi:oligogalacturonide lyase